MLAWPGSSWQSSIFFARLSMSLDQKMRASKQRLTANGSQVWKVQQTSFNPAHPCFLEHFGIRSIFHVGANSDSCHVDFTRLHMDRSYDSVWALWEEPAKQMRTSQPKASLYLGILNVIILVTTAPLAIHAYLNNDNFQGNLYTLASLCWIFAAIVNFRLYSKQRAEK